MLSLFAAAVVTALSAVPVSVSHCDFVQSGSFTRGLHVVYKNTSTKPIRTVVFEVRHGDHRSRIVDVGHFSPGTTIDHVLVPKALQLYHGLEPQGCSLTRVDFTDGSSWTGPAF